LEAHRRQVSWLRIGAACLLIVLPAWGWLTVQRWAQYESLNWDRIGRYAPMVWLWLGQSALTLSVGWALVGAISFTANSWLPRGAAVALAGLCGASWWAAMLHWFGTFDADTYLVQLALVGAIGLLRHGWPRPIVGERRCTTSPRAVVGYAICAFLSLCYMIEALVPPTQWDALTYHLPAVRAYARAGSFVSYPLYQTNLPMGPQMLAAPGVQRMDEIAETTRHTPHLQRLDHVVPQLNSWAVTLLAAWLVARTARRLTGRMSFGALAALLFLGDRMIEYEAASAYVDNWGAAAVIAGWLALMDVRPAARPTTHDPRSTISLWAFFYAMVGFLATMKFLYPPFLIAPWLAVVVPIAICKGVRAVLKPALMGTCIVLGLMAPWIAKSWMLTGTPLFPLFLGMSTLPMEDIETARRIGAWFSTLGAREGYPLLTWVRGPLELAFETERLYRFYAAHPFSPGPLWVMPVLALMFLGARRREVGLIALSLAAGTLWWWCTVRQVRFLQPVMPFLCIMAAVGMQRILSLAWRLRRRDGVESAIRWGNAALLLFFFAFLAERGGRLGYHWGIVATWRHELHSYTAGQFPDLDLFRRLNERRDMSPTTGVAMLLDNRSYYLKYPIVFADSSMHDPTYPLALGSDPATWSNKLRARGVGLVVVNVVALDYLRVTEQNPELWKDLDLLKAWLASPGFIEIDRGPSYVVGTLGP